MRGALLLHGFTGGPGCWTAVRAALPAAAVCLAPALAGHGETSIDVGAGFRREVDRLATVARKAGEGPWHLAGYSLGGRLAVGLLVEHPELFASATLIGARGGLGESERAARRASDERLAASIEQDGVARFVDRWEALPLFASQRSLPKDTLADQRQRRLAHSPPGLAGALRALGAGSMPDYRARLGGVAVPVTVMVGERDDKFRPLAAAMAAALPRGILETVPAAGHNLNLEAPRTVAAAIERGISR